MTPSARPGVQQIATSRAWLALELGEFVDAAADTLLGALTRSSTFTVTEEQRDAWLAQIALLQPALRGIGPDGAIAFEYAIPRLGGRVDAIVLAAGVAIVIEFKVGAHRFERGAFEQVWDYALDLKNFHAPSHFVAIAPILVATHAAPLPLQTQWHADGVMRPLLACATTLASALNAALQDRAAEPFDARHWLQGRYSPTPTIIEAARALYRDHGVEGITRSDAAAINLRVTSHAIVDEIERCRRHGRKAICFVTGVPGSGKTLVGLNVATRFSSPDEALHSVYLSGNGPLVAVLREALARDSAARAGGRRGSLGDARRQVKAFIQNVHHFRDDGLASSGPPPEHVAIFDEAQRAWDLAHTASFMARKKGRPGFDQSEPEFLVSCLARHDDWAVVVCLVGHGQEINAGEAGIGEWIRAWRRSFPDWHLRAPPALLDDTRHLDADARQWVRDHPNVRLDPALHLTVSLRSFRAENLADLVDALLEHDIARAIEAHRALSARYPIVITRDLQAGRRWLRAQARGSERIGLVCSSQAERLRPHAIDVRVPIDPVHWFLDEPDDIRSSHFLEDAATEFQVQGLELDWVGVVWDADLRSQEGSWDCWSFKGSRWERIRKAERQRYLVNAYRVLLTRARQGLVIVVPPGAADDPTRTPTFYESTWRLLRRCGLPELA